MGLGTTDVVGKLAAAGYEVGPAYINYLLRERIIAAPAKGAGGLLCWGEADVDRLRYELQRRGRGPAEGMGNGKGAVHVY